MTLIKIQAPKIYEEIESCDFSNGNFEGAYFKRCLFVSCKGIGTYLQKATFRQVLFKNSNFRYAYFDEAHFKEVWFEEVDLSEASLSQCKLEKVKFTQTKLIKNNFFKTPLKGIDFSNNEFVAPTVSEPPVELRGLMVDRFQAAELAKLMGISIVE